MVVQRTSHALPWVEKYRPEIYEDFVGNIEAVRELESWLKTWNQQRKKVALLAGPAGVGKTSVVYYLIKKYNFEYVEVNASDKRNKKAVEFLVGKSSTEGTVLQGAKVKKLVLVDEADGLFGNADRGGGSALAKAVQKTRIPIICTANDPSASAIKAAKRYMKVIEFNGLKDKEILDLLQIISKKENLDVSENTLLAITKNSGGDARSALNDLESIAFGMKGREISFAPRDQKQSFDSALTKIFKAKDFNSARRALDGADVDYRELLMYVFEHASKQTINATELFNVYELIAEADIYLSLCYKTQNWIFLKYFFTFISSIGLVKDSPFKYTKFSFPSFWALMGRFRGKRANIKNLIEKSINKLHCSDKTFEKEFFPYLRIIFNTDPKMAAGIAVWLQFDEENISFLTQNSARITKQIMTHYKEAYVEMAETWMKKAKEMPSMTLDFSKIVSSTEPKPKKKIKSNEDTKHKEETKLTNEKDSQDKKTKKKGSQTSLKKFISNDN